MDRTFTTRRTLHAALLLGAAASSFVACIPFDTEEPYSPPLNGGSDVVSAAKPPPPISGGTMVVTGDIAVASDPDRDRVLIVNLSDKKVSEVALNDGDEPGRVVIDAEGRAHVALRRGGDLVTIDLATKKVVDRREACPAPRGLAFDKNQSLLHVACSGGELVSLPSKGGEIVRSVRLDRDLRDVVVDGDRLLVTRFRTAEVLVVNATGAVEKRSAPPVFKMFEQEFEPAVAYRTVALPNGALAMVHQREMTTPVVIEQGGYTTGGCDGSIVHGAITVFPDGDTAMEGRPAMPAIPFAILPVDVAVSKDGQQMAMVGAGSDVVIRVNRSDLELEAEKSGDFGGQCAMSQFPTAVPGEPIAVFIDDNDQLLVQTREPAQIVNINSGSIIPLGGVSVKDSGHDMFHRNPNGFGALACASCHPEGGHDGRTWNFEEIGDRRTQDIRGGILATLPLHWDGDMDDLNMIMSEVFVKRMGGLAQGPRRIKAFARWLDAMPAQPASPPTDLAAVERGKALFNDAKVACATCHLGTRFTDNKTVDVGTGRPFQVPTLLNVADRAPFMHDGCAPTLHDRFNPACGGGDSHGKTSHLAPSDIDDLVAYLETL